MAIKKYQYDPNASKNKATGYKHGSISADLQKHRLALYTDTIRNFLREAPRLI
jgi:prolyl-tRNA editing enzyme YbaK/EbsC (Cys-tRNA(Pro) deacylase)